MNYQCDECETAMVRDPVLSAIDPRHDVHLCPTCGAFLVVKTDGTEGPMGPRDRRDRWGPFAEADGSGPLGRIEPMRDYWSRTSSSANEPANLIGSSRGEACPAVRLSKPVG